MNKANYIYSSSKFIVQTLESLTCIALFAYAPSREDEPGRLAFLQSLGTKKTYLERIGLAELLADREVESMHFEARLAIHSIGVIDFYPFYSNPKPHFQLSLHPRTHLHLCCPVSWTDKLRRPKLNK